MADDMTGGSRVDELVNLNRSAWEVWERLMAASKATFVLPQESSFAHSTASQANILRSCAILDPQTAPEAWALHVLTSAAQGVCLITPVGRSAHSADMHH